MTIINDDSNIVNKWSFKLIDDARVIIYNRHMFIVQAIDIENLTSAPRQCKCLKRDMLVIPDVNKADVI